MKNLYEPNATLVERIMAYVANDMHSEAATLAALADMLEENYHWDVTFDIELD